MMQVLILLVVGVRFLLEVGTVVGMLIGGLFRSVIWEKILFVMMAGLVTLVWSRYGAPSSSYALTGRYRIILEVVLYAIGIGCFFHLFGAKIGIIYSVIAVLDLVMIHLLRQ